MVAYPDALMVCGKPLFHDVQRDVITNPKVIVEVLSPRTKRYDHEEKLEKHQQNTSLTDYLLVSQKRPHIRHCSRNSRGCWEYVIETKLSGTSVIASIKCKLKLKDIYDRFEFPPLTLSENRWLNNS